MSGVNEREAAMLMLQGQATAAAGFALRAHMATELLKGLLDAPVFNEDGDPLPVEEFLRPKVHAAVQAADLLLEELRRPPATPRAH